MYIHVNTISMYCSLYGKWVYCLINYLLVLSSEFTSQLVHFHNTEASKHMQSRADIIWVLCNERCWRWLWSCWHGLICHMVYKCGRPVHRSVNPIEREKSTWSTSLGCGSHWEYNQHHTRGLLLITSAIQYSVPKGTRVSHVVVDPIVSMYIYSIGRSSFG